ncbi:sensor histidine kinase [Fodinicola acaciae]|uniref:sensor histidine kinase n=1 Tax=Fodinicola acaciae TaxID=2681555 RepID=UPI0013D5232F|nr:HAMP domain-containing sensor histidine kinase [Fodinicola acaciae]
MSWFRRQGLGFRIGLVTTAVAVVCVLVAAAVSYPLIRSAAETQARKQLARQAALVAGLGPQRSTSTRVRQLLGSAGIRLAVVRPDEPVRGPRLPEADLRALAAGRDISRIETLDGQRVYVEGRAMESGGGIALVQVANIAPKDQEEFFWRMLLSALVGLLVAVIAGVLLARRLARPLRRAAAGARRMAAGERSVRVDASGPAEVASVAEAVNSLAAALEVSEGRQRDFLLSVSHELRTPLTTVKGFAEALVDGVADDVPGTGRVMLAEAERLDRLIGDLLDLARLQAQDFRLDFADVDVTEVVRAAARAWSARRADFRAEIGEGPVVVRTDAGRLRQVIDGLMDNATRVCPAGAPVVLALRKETGAAVIEVRDGGPGLTADDMTVAFEKSVLSQRYQGERAGSAGIGLALVHGLVVRLGGTIEVSAAPEGGARFSVRLPSA